MGKSDKSVKKQERRFSQEQYDFLKKCSEKGAEGIKEWNEWRKKNPEEEVFLESTDLRRFYLRGALLNASSVVDYKGAVVETWELDEVDMKENFRFNPNKIQDYSGKVYMEGAFLLGADLERANLIGAHLEGANLRYANLKGANLRIAHLRGVQGDNSNLEQTNLYFAKLEGACFARAIVDSSTLFWGCATDRKTDFTSVSLESMRIQEGKRDLLRYNTRRRYWERWHGYTDWGEYPGATKRRSKTGRMLRWPVRAFWMISDYGLSTGRIILSFVLLAFLFATVYFALGARDYYLLDIREQPGIVSDLFKTVPAEDPVPDAYYAAIIYFRSVYFSIVTMTTLGFGDMYARAQSIFGHILLSLQVILGYVLLAALVTRFAVLFTAGGPAGGFSEREKNGSRKVSKNNK